MTHILIATDLLPLIGLGLFLCFVIFVLGRAANSGQLRVRRHRRNFWDRDDSNLSIFGQTGLLDPPAASTSQDDLSIYRPHDNVSTVFDSRTDDTSSTGSSGISDLVNWSSGGSYENSGGLLGDRFGSSSGHNSGGGLVDLFGSSSSHNSGGGLGDLLGSFGHNSGGGLGDSIGSSFGDSGGGSFSGSGGLGDSLGGSFGENSSGGLGDSLGSSFGDSGGGGGLGDSLSSFGDSGGDSSSSNN